MRRALPKARGPGADKVYTPGAPGEFAAPAGGPFGGRGCHNTLLAIVIALAAIPALAGDQVVLASGLEVRFHDRIDEAPTWRYRYVMPALSGGGLEFATVASDMERLCAEHALPQLLEEDRHPRRIVVTLMAEPVDFGAISPGTRQFFESYSIEDGLCIWEVF